MNENDEVAQAMLPDYLAWLKTINGNRTMQNCRIFVGFDPILREESAPRCESIAFALYRLSGRLDS